MNIGAIMNIYHQIRQNPVQMLSRRFNIPQGLDTSDPNTIIKHLLDTGQVTEGQINQARNNPILQMFRY